MKPVHLKFQRHGVQNKWSAGVAYLSLLVIIFLFSVAVLATVTVHSFEQRRLAEEELLFVGDQFRAALISYANATPSGGKRYPHSLEDLVADHRSAKVRRHLRKIYADPLTNSYDWGIISRHGDGIEAVFSKSSEHPIKISQFPLKYEGFNNSTSYSDWFFGS